MPFIKNDIEAELYSYIGGICKNLECYPVQINGDKDHVHILCILSRKIALMKLIEEVKSHSSKWIKTKDPKYKDFYWKKGYGCFSVNPRELDNVVEYIKMQKEHHQKISFQKEYVKFLNNYDIKFDEKYVWD